MKTEQMVEVMQAHLAGKKVEIYNPDDDFWEQIDNPAWNWCSFKYRIKKEEPKLVAHYPALIGGSDGIYIADYIYPTFEAAKKMYSRAIRLATEYPPIMLPEKQE